MNVPTLIVQVAGGGVGLGAGAAALWFRKGGRAHAKAGTMFFLSMLVLLGTGFVMALAIADRGVALSAIFGIYLIATARETARRRDGRTGRFEAAGLAVAAACAAANFTLGIEAMVAPSGTLDGFPPTPYFVLGGLAALAAMIFWLVRVRFGGRLPRLRPARAAA
jgi:hypothetical protein